MAEVTVSVQRFDGGIADDYTNGNSGECAICKQYDIFTYPRRLHPLRGMTNSGEITDSLMANMILAPNGAMFGVGRDPANPTKPELYKRLGYGASDFWTDFTTDNASGIAAGSSSDDFLVYFADQANARKIYWATQSAINVSDPADGSVQDTEAAAFTGGFTAIGQGLVHPSDKILYFPFKDAASCYVGTIASNAGDPFGTINFTATAFTFPLRYRAYCLSYFDDFLAIPMTQTGVSANKDQSVVGLWSRDLSTSTFTKLIPWGSGLLKVLNNLNGTLIGISALASELGSAAAQDQDKIQIKIWEGGAEPIIIKELVATRLTTTNPSCSINQRVNFVHNNRLYFSVNVVNGFTNGNYYGLWSVGKNKFGNWTVTMERVATNANSETGVIAAAMYGDFLTCVHTTDGTITNTINGNTLSAIYGATSVYESVINPDMPTADRDNKKKLKGVYCSYLPLPTDGQIVMKYRVDVSPNASGTTLGNGWTTVFTETTDGATYTEMPNDAAGSQFTDGRKYEFRIESTGGAIVTGFGYRYENDETLV